MFDGGIITADYSKINKDKWKGDIMCTAATYKTKDFYFGRTLDYEFSYGDEITITPRNYNFKFRHMGDLNTHYAIIGMAHVVNDYPLYYDAFNEKGLCMAGLNFVGNAVYKEVDNNNCKDNVAQFEFIPWILSKCASVKEAREAINQMNLVGTVFNEKLPAAQLHWIIADKDETITVESVKDGLMVYDNKIGVLTNNPPFPMQMFLLNQYMGLSENQPENTFAKDIELQKYSRGMGAIGLPGDLSSTSRFARVAFVKAHSISADTEEESVSQFFHILGSVDQQRGACYVADGKFEITIYTSCCNADKGIYYYTSYDNHQISAVNMYNENLDANVIVRYPLLKQENIMRQN